MNDTPNSNRTHIAIFGRRNAGKSSIINAIANQYIAIVSNTAGTTTDPVKKAIEINGIGACTIVDTAGFDDDGELGALRIERTKKIMESSDIALFVFDASFINNDYSLELKWKNKLESLEIPIIAVLNKIDLNADYKNIEQNIKEIFNLETVSISADNKINIDKLIDAIKLTIPKTEEISITGHIIKEDDIVMLVMPQDIQAPKGRLILPQVQTIRDILDNKAVIIASTFDKFENALKALSKAPKVIITDSQVFKEVEKLKPKESLLTSFSVLFARYKGDEKIYKKGADFIDSLTKYSKILIAESCTHIPLEGDIGRVKIPNLLKNKFGFEFDIDYVAGNDFPDDLSKYDLVIHCGGCMGTRKHILNRIRICEEQNIPITNYGMTIAKINGVQYI
ncbi:[FeFe] hydrogenase H-cluster maturation GTPase HydF [Brachyspira hyodysenteriae]|uniref:[FeFe] hydrogenase H-cluster maturation GTPase HydF n=1 Tax=Brachyspira hyodysenteriae TaxID=159 RepID=UPI00063D9F15|nr:[FeFe] hydrogenase H-cluster maturation GTPase HydF [Brachyspira hyodysenteriae]KLI40864.1 GTP-binding protein [Brachyspira hyodysenteriae]MCZ9869752.1 [FeFe] hydrogenase H-cluster maturation GTPase HydF [Brachyspira hyodysenteriae]MCZ9879444.1 [FeFe] hydrogenase H-cluster maturation GTPase HydF [Brachyspira hyodysenteriae]MCZ9893254.1 [FeFe] hydrogenase H-cluster maturation GTPase HydF [Brachyspira hyodysenteriae]MCZ9897042.1 [FeFe] hydrogenase H-cluster maturation GTPase HydF [Brachyspira